MTELRIDSIYKNDLDLKRFSLMLNNNSQCYKFYWLEALVNLLVTDGRDTVTFFDAACEMIVEAWYTVSEYHLHMGSIYGTESKNAIERAVNYIQFKTDLTSNAGKDMILEAIDTIKEDKAFQKIIMQMTDDVPYRLLSPFVSELKGNDPIWHSDKRLIEYFGLVNKKTPLPYTMEYESHINKTVHWNAPWAAMVKDNFIIIQEWIRSKKIRYLQDRNPGVPGIIYKLDPVSERKLHNVHRLWDAVMDAENVIDVYSGETLNGSRYDIDHFIPWSYVTADELWNLTPAEKRVNISKSNHLPDWDNYFDIFTENQIQLFNSIIKVEGIRELFEKCRNNNLNTLWASNLYNSNNAETFKAMLRDNMRPIYLAARLQGYEIWRYKGEGISC